MSETETDSESESDEEVFINPNLYGEMNTTIELLKVSPPHKGDPKMKQFYPLKSNAPQEDYLSWRRNISGAFQLKEMDYLLADYNLEKPNDQNRTEHRYWLIIIEAARLYLEKCLEGNCKALRRIRENPEYRIVDMILALDDCYTKRKHENE